jgi:hypothetical protein
MQTASLDMLERTQLPADQARAILRVMELEISAHESALATRDDIKDAAHRLELRIESLRGEVLAELKGSESKTARWVLTCTMGQAAMIAGAVYFALMHLRP